MKNILESQKNTQAILIYSNSQEGRQIYVKAFQNKRKSKGTPLERILKNPNKIQTKNQLKQLKRRRLPFAKRS